MLGAAVAGLPLAYFWPQAGWPAFAFGIAGIGWGIGAMRRHDRDWTAYTHALKLWQSGVTAPGPDAWRRLVEAEGLGGSVAEREREQTMAFRAEPLENGLTAVRSRLGGVPEVPADFIWPRSGSNPWKFFGQVALEELPDVPHELPRDGMLSIFNQESFGHDATTYYFPAGVPLVHLKPPREAEVGTPVPLRFQAYEEVPKIDGCDDETLTEIRDYLAGDLLALHGCPDESSLVLWQAIDGYRDRKRAYLDLADLRARDFSRVVHN